MAPRISLALALHNHQPVGNFGWVIAENYETAYLPMLEALDRHPGVRLSPPLHGAAARVVRGGAPGLPRPPASPRRARPGRDPRRRLLRAGPRLAAGARPHRPARSAWATSSRRLFGRRPRGAWLAERVWEPDLPTSLVDGGYEWTILDDAHFRAAAIPEEDLWGPYTTEDQGRLVDVFGTEQGLRYRIPFRDVEDVIAYLRDHATEDGSRVGMMGDDGEKFGAWPTTWEHCWGERRWVERFFDALEANADWLTTVDPVRLAGPPPSDRARVRPDRLVRGDGRVGAAARREPSPSAPCFHRAQAERRPEARWLRGAFWRNFQVKYREINDLHKQMLRVSDKVEAMPPGPARDRALDHLFRGQSNDCYWHGLFGGIYISHMRLATYEHLIAAEDLADTDAARPAGAAGGRPPRSRSGTSTRTASTRSS